MKKLLFLSIFVLSSFISFAQSYYISVGSRIYRINPTNCSTTLVCGPISVFTGGGTITGDITDIAFHPNGNLYGIVANFIITIDTVSCTSTTLNNIGFGGVNSLVADASGNLYAAGNSTLYSVDPITGVLTVLGALPCNPAGDLAFVDSELFVTCQNGDLIKVNISNPPASIVVGNLGTSEYWFGLWTNFVDCNTMAIYAAEYGGDVYEVDPTDASKTLFCSTGLTGLNGATMVGDYNASACDVLNANFTASSQTTCEGECITFTDQSTTPAPGGITSWAWTFNGGTPSSFSGQNPPCITYNTPGTYPVQLSIIDADSDTDDTITISSYITVHSLPTFTIGKTNPSCGSSDGEIIITPSPGVTITSYSIDGGTTSQPSGTFSNIGAGSIAISVIDDNGCEKDSLISLNSSAGPSIDNFNITPPTCTTSCDGAITAVVTGGTAPLTYEWTDDLGNPVGTNSVTITGLCEGDYTLNVTDAAGGSGTISIYSEDFNSGAPTWTLNVSLGGEGADPNFFTISDGEGGVTPPGCGTANNGDPTLHITSVFNPTGGAAYDAGGLCGFWYCPETHRQAESGVINTTGYTGLTLSFDFIANGAIPNDQATVWYNDGGGWNQLGSALSSGVCGSGQGMWTAYSQVLPASCDNNPNLKIAIRWDNNDDGAGTDPSVAINNIEITTTGGGGSPCFASGVATVTAPNPIVIDNINITDASCGNPNGGVVVAASGGTGTINYSINGGTTTQPSGTFSNLPSGSITVSVIDDNSCQRDSTVMVGDAGLTGPNQPSAIIGNITVCSGASENYSVTNVSGVTYVWTYSGTGTVTGTGNAISLDNITSNGTLTVTPSNACGNGTPQTINITISDVPSQPSVITGNLTVCNGDSESYSVTNVSGVTYTWTYSGTGTINGSGNAISLDNITAGGTLTVTPSNTCGNGLAQTVALTMSDVPNQPSAITGDALLPCGVATSNYSVTNVGGITYTWTYSGSGAITGSGNAITLGNITTSGTLTVTPSNSCGNGTPQTIAIDFADGPSIINIATTAPTCGNSDGGIDITVSGGTTPYDFSWSNGTTTEDLSNIPSGTYTVTLTDNHGCSADSTITLNYLSAPIIDNIAVTQTSCTVNDGTITITASGVPGSLEYSIDNGTSFQTDDGLFTGLGTGIYNIIVKDANGCDAIGTATITQMNAPVLTLVNSADVTCSGNDDGSIEVIANGGTPTYTYSWSPNVSTTETATNLAAGSYTITVTDGAGCTDNLQVTISETDAIAIIETITASGCGQKNGSIALQVTGGYGNYTYNWNPNVSTSATASGLGSGTYGVTVTDGNGCTQTGSYNVGMSGSFYLEIIPSYITIHQGEEIDIHLTIDPNITVDSIVWSPAEGLSCTDCKNPVAAPETSTTYYVEVFSDDGCSSMDSIVITVKSPCANIYVPTSFSPNGDGMNDLQCVMGTCIATMDFTIFDRWGEVVFQTADQKECWDGMFRGQLVQSGVYVYKLKATLENGEKIEESGNINVVR